MRIMASGSFEGYEKAMSSARLDRYGGNLKRIAKANARDDQMQMIRSNRFRASLVDDPLRSSPDLIQAIEASRKLPRNGG